jgi:hypothetical protein
MTMTDTNMLGLRTANEAFFHRNPQTFGFGQIIFGKRWMGFDFKFKKFSIKQAFFINEIFSSRVKASKQKKT